MGEFSQKVIKWIMFGFNFILWIIGLSLIIAGAVAQSHYKGYSHFIEKSDVTVTAPALVIAVGVFIFIVAFLGCCGAFRDSYPMLMGFAVIVGIIFIVQLSGGIAGYVQKKHIAELGDFFQVYQEQYAANNSDIINVVDAVQPSLSCCGSLNYKDWYGHLNRTAVNSTVPIGFVPQSCCMKGRNCTGELDANSLSLNCSPEKFSASCKIYVAGCEAPIKVMLEKAIAGIAGAAIGLAFVELIGVVFACYLAKRIRSGYVYA